MNQTSPERKPDDLLSVAEIGEALTMGESTVWLFAKRHGLPRYRIPARGKTTLFRWGDVIDAYNRPISVDVGGRHEGDAKKEAA